MFLNALHCRNHSGKIPVWLMRQAGRYMASYRELRSRYSFLEMCHQPELIAEVTLLPIKRFGFDAAILFSDILMIPEALGVGLHFEEGRGPVIHRPISTVQDIHNLIPLQENALQFVAEGIRCVKPSLKVPLIGFCGAPFTVACYMIEGGSSRDFKKTKQWIYQRPEAFHQLLNIICDCSIEYLKMQINAGVDAIQIFDSWANILAYPQFQEFSLKYLDKITKALEKRVPTILFCKGSSIFYKELAAIQPNAISLDWNCNISEVRKKTLSNIALQGNLDPAVLYSCSDTIKREVKNIIEEMREENGYIFNLGHGISPDVAESAVDILLEAIR